MGAKELLAYAVAGKLRKGIEFRTACCEVFADNDITDFDTQAKLMREFGVILGNVSAERQRQRGMRLFKKNPIRKTSQSVSTVTGKPITKEQQIMFASVTAFMKAGAIFKKNSDALDGDRYRPRPHRWRR
jgi:hypothetical protein